MKCRICDHDVDLILDLGYQPLANALLSSPNEKCAEYPLKFYFCDMCQYGMVPDMDSSGIFDDSYPYYTSVNTSYVRQCQEWVMKYRREFQPRSVLEIGSNDGYMLENFKDIEHVGYEPSFGPHEKALSRGIKSENQFFSSDRLSGNYDLIIANNVIAHTPKLHGIVQGIYRNLSSRGVAVIEFPTLNNLVEKRQYDTIYQEHYSYFTLSSLCILFGQYFMGLVKYEEIPSHGGSIRAYFSTNFPVHKINSELDMGLFSTVVFKDKLASLHKIIEYKMDGKTMVLFGAAAKGNTFLNYLGVGTDFFDYCVDETPAKIGKFLPGSRIPIVDMEMIKKTRPDVIWILPWNFKTEIMQKLEFTKAWNCKIESSK